MLLDQAGAGTQSLAGTDMKRTKSTRSKKDAAREERIIMQIVVDAYNAEERASGWYAYLEGVLDFPFTATCIHKRQISPLQVGDEVAVIGIADSAECQREIFVTIPWERNGLAVPLSQLKPSSRTTEETKEAVEDWLYWVSMGYEF